jgi:hypothetical protein
MGRRPAETACLCPSEGAKVGAKAEARRGRRAACPKRMAVAPLKRGTIIVSVLEGGDASECAGGGGFNSYENLPLVKVGFWKYRS